MALLIFSESINQKSINFFGENVPHLCINSKLLYWPNCAKKIWILRCRAHASLMHVSVFLFVAPKRWVWKCRGHASVSVGKSLHAVFFFPLRLPRVFGLASAASRLNAGTLTSWAEESCRLIPRFFTCQLCLLHTGSPDKLWTALQAALNYWSASQCELFSPLLR